MNYEELRLKFTPEFLEEFRFDAEFCALFNTMQRGMTPFQVIEHLCKAKKELFEHYKKQMELAELQYKLNRYEVFKDEK